MYYIVGLELTVCKEAVQYKWLWEMLARCTHQKEDTPVGRYLIYY
jgi:hypothetical protein